MSPLASDELFEHDTTAATPGMMHARATVLMTMGLSGWPMRCHGSRLWLNGLIRKDEEPATPLGAMKPFDHLSGAHIAPSDGTVEAISLAKAARPPRAPSQVKTDRALLTTHEPTALPLRPGGRTLSE